MSLPAPTTLIGGYEPLAFDRFSANIMWSPVPGAAKYKLYRDLNTIVIDASAVETINYENQDLLIYRDTTAWTTSQPLDVFFWVSALELDATAVPYPTYVEGELSDALTHLHPFAIRIIEECRSMIGDDFRIFGDANPAGNCVEQVSAYNYKIALDQALMDINSSPTPTNFHYGNFPHTWKNLLSIGTLVWMLPRLILFEKAKAMQFQDQGQEWSPPDLSEALKLLQDMYKTMYDERRITIKHNVRPLPKAIGSLRALFISPQLLKWRHVPTGRPYF